MAAGSGRRFPAAARAAGGDRGSFTAELAAGLPALLLLLLAGLTAVNAVSAQASCLHAAREAALAAARGADGSAGGGRAAPPGAEVAVSVDGDRVQATVRAPVRTLGGRLPRITVVATAVAAVEPGADEGSW
ncbi:TadE family type IV pilus minor pilin [Micromonospora parathelypteridis]|uniref:TadE family type IV pilus minor pilin n=1 Tax=Micromonospora parathelypteridis TaxID=1839617 RepID=UPI00160E9B92|nr:TadE family type IV pilus minor pilin [Micromonospora parathelypteridis]